VRRCGRTLNPSTRYTLPWTRYTLPWTRYTLPWTRYTLPWTRYTLVAALAALLLLALAAPVHALDKQGSAHGGEVGGADSGFAISGSLLGGVAFFNPSYAARPDNTGLTLLRFAPHFDIDLIGSRLSIPLDMNVFTDRERPGLQKLLPSEFDVITGATSTWPLGPPAAIEFGARVERDMPVDYGSFTQSYADLRTRLLYSLKKSVPSVRSMLAEGDIAGYLTLGWFAYNPSYAARPDNTGRALFRYAAHAGVSAWDGYLLFSIDSVLFTNRYHKPLAPSELDLTLDAGSTLGPIEVHVAYERDMPIDQGNFVQQLALAYVTWGFDLVD
jgi:hypothetical protein